VRRHRHVLLCALLPALLLGGPAVYGQVHGQQGGGADQARRAVLEARRDSLEAQIMNRFLLQLGRELRLDDDQRARAERAMRTGAARRRELMSSSAELRARLHRAVRDPGTSDAALVLLLTEHEALRQRENVLWRLEQDELAEVLTPRQRVHFLLLWVRFQDDVRQILMQQMRPPGSGRR
jgi:hypothetical protein